MRVVDADEVRARAPLPKLIECLERAFRGDAEVPQRLVLEQPGGDGGRYFLAMPAFDADGSTAVKLVTFRPENAGSGLPVVQAVIVVFSSDGTPAAVLDGTMITRLRTAAASALASRFLSRADSSRLTVIGTGALAPWMAAAHAFVRPIGRIEVWGRRRERVEATVHAVRELVERPIEICAAPSLEESVHAADIVSCATSSPTAVIAGRWLQPGCHVDLVGSFSQTTREADDDVVRRARLFVDTFEGALAEAGDLLDPIARGVISRERIEGELADLVRGRVDRRRSADEITLFKSVGTALEDLATARMVLDQGE
jgi:ornithine cyclodeaminase